MDDLISRKALMKYMRDYKWEFALNSDFSKAIEMVDVQPTVEAVPKSYAEQIRWERDVAVGQLNEIGCQFGQKMDEVKKKLEVVHGKWIKSQSMPRSAKCSECKCWITKHSVNELWFRYCPHCGADMRTSAE